MNAAYWRTIYDYGYWARDRLLAAAAGLSDEEFCAPNGFVYGSIRGILAHVIGAEASWFARIQGQAPSPPTAEALPSVAALAESWRETEAATRSYLAGVSDADLLADVTLRRRDGSTTTLPLWQILAQVANHGTQHRSEAAEALTMVGRSPGDLDLLRYFPESSRR
jgi:uncharacterized damage-inducible protein DinB